MVRYSFNAYANQLDFVIFAFSIKKKKRYKADVTRLCFLCFSCWSYLLAESLDIGLGELLALHQVLDPAINITDISNSRHFLNTVQTEGVGVVTGLKKKRLQEAFLHPGVKK